MFSSSALVALVLAGCAGTTQYPAKNSAAYMVFFTATRSSDHAAISSGSLPVALGSEASVKPASELPTETGPTLPEFNVRLERSTQPGVYELVTRAAVREAIRNKKGKLKINQRFIGALVPTRLGETQAVSTESDPVHLEARLERR